MADVKTGEFAREMVKDIKKTDMPPVTVESAVTLMKIFPVTMARLLEEGKTVEIRKGQGMVQGIFLPFAIAIDDDAADARTGGMGSTDR